MRGDEAMTKRPTTYCDRCESTVYSDFPHTCTDMKALREQQERERALTVAERAEFAQMRQTIMDQGAEIAALRPVAEAAAAYVKVAPFAGQRPALYRTRKNQIIEAVRAWREGRSCH